jgi:hypothetical protein
VSIYFIGIPLFALKARKRFIPNNSLARPGIVDKAIIGTKRTTAALQQIGRFPTRADNANVGPD